VYVYRLLSGGTIEEKVFQRQISKEGLQQVKALGKWLLTLDTDDAACPWCRIALLNSKGG